MQLNKASKKTTKNAEKAASAVPEQTASAEVPASKPRVSRSSKTKKSEGQEMTSGKHLHKPASPVVAESAVSPEPRSIATPAAAVTGAKSQPATPVASAAHPQAIAELAYSYWVSRNYAHGSAEDDWFKAEKELAAR